MRASFYISTLVWFTLFPLINDSSYLCHFLRDVQHTDVIGKQRWSFVVSNTFSLANCDIGALFLIPRF